MLQFIDVLLEVNQRMNLTGVKTKEECIERHLNDSLSLLEPMQKRIGQGYTGLRVIDVGSGAGLPGMVLAIAKPTWKIVLLDATRKRCKFMEDAASSIGLENVEVVWSRAEEAAQLPEHREMYDFCVTRGLAEMRTLAELTLPFLAKGAYLVAAKGSSISAEVNAAQRAIFKLGGEVEGIEVVNSISPLGPRTAVMVKKVKSTPPKYPRRPGMPKSNPL
eukprot:TRINITY_DN63283_c0_g1_i3.p1 TRINITY_DN63283_c0_g1~~TRINITY_DN63283_c0_g1_i3.p1  ORF type:complete len:219 (+),score=32.26 TRINITY_DN63283_c0_g1_i3:123-779(+)